MVRTRWGQREAALRRPGPGTGAYIDRAVELTNARLAAGLGLAPEVLGADEVGTLVTAWATGGSLGAVLGADHLDAVARLLARLHRLEGPWAGRIDVLGRFDRYLFLASRGPEVAGAQWFVELAGCRGALADRARALEVGAPPAAACHGDPWPANLVTDGSNLLLIDWEYSGRGDPTWDLATFVAEAGLTASAASDLLGAYHEAGGWSAVTEDRVRQYLPLCDAVWAAWAALQVANANRTTDHVSYAVARTRAARRHLGESDQSSPSTRRSSSVVDRGAPSTSLV